jgi:hypothetical protein
LVDVEERAGRPLTSERRDVDHPFERRLGGPEIRKDLVDAVRYPVEPMTTVISPWRCRRNDIRAIRLDALSMRRHVPGHIVNAKCCSDVLVWREHH